MSIEEIISGFFIGSLFVFYLYVVYNKSEYDKMMDQYENRKESYYS